MRTTPSLYPLNRSNFALKEILRGVDIESNCTTWAPLSISTLSTVPVPKVEWITCSPSWKSISLLSSGRYFCETSM